MSRTRPNIIITGTPAVGKTSHCELLAENSGLQHLPVNQIVKEKRCHEGWNDEYKSWIVDEDKLLDTLEEDHAVSAQGGFLIDWHACDLFPESWIDLVVVLRTDSQKLYDRLKARGYGEKKLQENLDSEIMGILSEEAIEGFEGKIVVELKSDTEGDVTANVGRVEEWIRDWSKERAKGDRLENDQENIG
ncbi:uncharacterized protein KY384_003647 [Bacidia gigantensis]|uniref:uncharacterized protein n=1 Tax=Bacidia gigantensis TaxID=2732470 RepID=UPI001D05A955|nr:uncharacterized protein KY384_003647 [Bacidia gigantensis]KAG8532011.1 hypothetical protein KY384_003647 [Bacidia gigantensis]